MHIIFTIYCFRIVEALCFYESFKNWVNICLNPNIESAVRVGHVRQKWYEKLQIEVLNQLDYG